MIAKGDGDGDIAVCAGGRDSFRYKGLVAYVDSIEDADGEACSTTAEELAKLFKCGNRVHALLHNENVGNLQKWVRYCAAAAGLAWAGAAAGFG